LLVGLTGYVGFFGWPLWGGLRTLGWRATPCEVVSSRVRSEFHGGLVSFTSYWPGVVYRYHVNGVTYRANAVNRTDVGSPWSYGPRRVARRYPPGSRATCFVDPADPSEAVLTRSVSGSQWFGAWPVIMAALGAAGVYQSIAGRGVRVGTPRLWGTLALWAATTCAVDVLWVTGTVLYADCRDGLAEWPEFAAVGVAGTLAALLVIVWVNHALGLRGDRGGRPACGIRWVSPAVWDREMDERPQAGGKGK
jgi:hypothetical protein